LIKRNILAAPFERAFKEQEQFEDEKQANPNPELMAVHYREAIYVKASQDRVTVIFNTRFKDETDRVFGKVFLQVSS
jgi:actin related protein 2/3 complex subunit 2